METLNGSRRIVAGSIRYLRDWSDLEKTILHLCCEVYPAEAFLHGVDGSKYANKLFLASESHILAVLEEIGNLHHELELFRKGPTMDLTQVLDAQNFLLSLRAEIQADRKDPQAPLEIVLYGLWIHLVKSYHLGSTDFFDTRLFSDACGVLREAIARWKDSSIASPVVKLVLEDISSLKQICGCITERFGSVGKDNETGIGDLMAVALEYSQNLHGSDEEIVRQDYDRELRLRYGYSDSSASLMEEGKQNVQNLLVHCTNFARQTIEYENDMRLTAECDLKILRNAVSLVTNAKYDADSTFEPLTALEKFRLIASETSEIAQEFIVAPESGRVALSDCPAYLSHGLPFASCMPIYKIDIDYVQFVDTLSNAPVSYFFALPDHSSSVAAMLSSYVHGVYGHSFNFLHIGSSSLSPLRKFPLGLSVLSEGLAFFRETDFIRSAERNLANGQLSRTRILGENREMMERRLRGLKLLASTWELIRTVREVVDVGVNSGLMSYEECVDYIMKHSAYDRNVAEHEMLRFLAYPGYPAGYPYLASRIGSKRKIAIALDRLAEFNTFVSSLGWISTSRLTDELERWGPIA